MHDIGENKQLQQKLTYSALKDASCLKVLDSIRLIWLYCSPLLRKMHKATNIKCPTGQTKILILMHNVCVVVLGVELLTSPAVRSSGKSWADALSGCKTAPYNNTQIITVTNCGFIAWKIMGVTG